MELLKIGEKMAFFLSWNCLQSCDPPLPQLPHCSPFVLYNVFIMSHFHNTIEPNVSVTPLEYYKETQNITITATSDQSMQQDRQSGFVILFGHGYFIHAGNHGLVLPISLKRESEAVCKCWYCKYTGSVFCRAFFMYLKSM